ARPDGRLPQARPAGAGLHSSMSSQSRQTPNLAIATVYGRTRFGACRSAASMVLPGPAASIGDTWADGLERSGFEWRCGRQPGDCGLGGSADLLAVSYP